MINPKITKIVEDTLKEFVEGQEFFTNLDLRIRNRECIEILLSHIPKEFKDCRIIFTGSFGRTALREFPRETYMLLPGGLRHMKEYNLSVFKSFISGKKFILLDDSFCSGRTRNLVEKEIALQGGELKRTFVIYDGSQYQDNRIESLYRYFDYHNLQGEKI